MATRQPVNHDIPVLTEKLDQVISTISEMRNETRESSEYQRKHNDEVNRLLAKHDVKIEHVEGEVRNWKAINSVGVLISGAMAALATWLTTK